MPAKLSKCECFIVGVGESADMTWPAVTSRVDEISYKLRYGHPLDKCEQSVAASVMDAYMTMVLAPIKKRNAVCKQVKEVSR